MSVEKNFDLTRGRVEQFETNGGYLKTSRQEGTPKWLEETRQKFHATYPYPNQVEGEDRGIKMMREAMYLVGDKNYRFSVAFGPSGETVGVVCWKKNRYESDYMRQHYKEMYLAFVGSSGRLAGAGSVLMVEVAKAAVKADRAVFAYVSHAGHFYWDLGWEMIKADPSNDHWLWPLEACQAIVAACAMEKVPEAPSL